MDEHYLRTMAAHQALIQVSDNPSQFRGVSPSARLMDQAYRAWRDQKYGPAVGMDIMRVPF
ncbi:hypothetical protein MMAN_58070 [Mycobacterium mantenii]|uniref:Uncharacterized protein n=1 Tax=Mycobacterium mantenii TaxID=560555 RepID=A0A1X0G3W3_MYCNT|nr:hypothetical protein [Mycobacterium mantenii]MCV7243829.1 hypothetical protein [Mycobacterium mantenii]ORB08721.1 hypothetical protein BST30_01920 [Mycobacterium mantenii]BBY35891.1 hypothetical protein MMAN_00250 [Mycobacterium mantenii]BBY41673.1 hypothetical protein MMAN_58070 [Mycobacterium mantenii]